MRNKVTYTVRWRRLSFILATILACSMFWWALFQAARALSRGEPPHRAAFVMTAVDLADAGSRRLLLDPPASHAG